jgi:tetratricopeptide (TPR) repeat protein
MSKPSFLSIVSVCLVFGLLVLPLTGIGSDIQQKVKKAKAELQAGVNAWNPEKIQAAKDMFLNLLLTEENENAYLNYYIALCDYRLVSYEISENLMDEAGMHVADAKKHLEKAMELKPDWGEPCALYASVLGFEISLDWDKAMSLAMEINEYFGKAFDLEPKNPRINLLKGLSDLYTPAQYGGGPDAAISSLTHAVDLFETEKAPDPLKPAWGKEEALSFLGTAYLEKGDNSKARELFLKALEVNPEFGLAKENLEKVKK